MLHWLGFHDWCPVWHDGWSSLFHKVGWRCRRPGCNAKRETWPDWTEHECSDIKARIAAGATGEGEPFESEADKQDYYRGEYIGERYRKR